MTSGAEPLAPATPRPVGVVGCGRMGASVIRRLVDLDHRVVAYDPDPIARARLLSMEAEAAATTSDVARETGTVLLSLPHGQAVATALHGEHGLLRATRRSGTIVDLSTISPSAASSASTACAEAGWRYISGPVIGGVSNCGSWTILLDSTEPEEPTRQVLSELGRVELLGPTGAGLRIKLLNNMMLAITAAGLMEILELARASGLDLDLMHRVLTDSRSVAVGPLFATALPRALRGETGNSFGINLLLKDARLATELGADYGEATRLLEQATSEIGRRAREFPSDADFATLLAAAGKPKDGSK